MAKSVSDDGIFKKWFEKLLSTEHLRNRIDWNTEHETIRENEGECFKCCLKEIIQGSERIDGHTRKRLLYVLDNSTGWAYVELWWMMVYCFETIERVPYTTLKWVKERKKT
jgi:hypothetical protein